MTGLRVGLLGGSFNPAHEGHRHISLLALKVLQLDEVWWMVSPQNPLKPLKDMAPFEERLGEAVNMAKHPRIRVTDIEQRLGTRYTSGSLAVLKDCFPKTNFVWIMGADNLKQISRWHRWTRIFNQVPIAVFDRAPYSFGALAGKAAKAFCRFKRKRSDACNLPDMAPPAWMFFHTQLHPGSATNIRAHKSRGEIASAKKRKIPECE
ncbi:MAG: nicotinate-nucleotide adenylyltransferase [Pseudomonadota bacterium]|nr:nicotinate-nucleotide adenylyltransferase [Pseudomonadota bacterium]